LTGCRQAGKTSACRGIVRLAATRGWRVAGVLSPAIFRNGVKVGVETIDLHSGQSRPLASRRLSRHGGLLGYEFDDVALAWANDVVASSYPCDLLIIDELGPLELEQGKGLVAAVEVLRGGCYRWAIVVVRPELVPVFKERLGRPCRVVDVGELFGSAAEAQSGGPTSPLEVCIFEKLFAPAS